MEGAGSFGSLSVLTRIMTRMHRRRLPGTATSVAPMSAVLFQPACLAAVAGNPAFRSGVVVKYTAATSRSTSWLASIRAVSNSRVAPWMDSTVFSSAIVAPRMPRHIMGGSPIPGVGSALAYGVRPTASSGRISHRGSGLSGQFGYQPRRACHQFVSW